MKPNGHPSTRRIAALLGAVAVLSATFLLPTLELQSQSPGIGRVVRYRKTLTAERNGETKDLLTGDWLHSGATIRTEKGKAELELWGGATLHLGKNTVVELTGHDRETGQTALKIETGHVRIVATGLPEGAVVEVDTPKFQLTAEQPELFFRLERRLTEVASFAGDATVLTRDGTELSLTKGTYAIFALTEQKPSVESIPAWYQKMMKGMLSFKASKK